VVTLNRSAIIVKAKQPFLDWIRAMDPTTGALDLADLNREPTIYLIPESANENDAYQYLQRVYVEILQQELSERYPHRGDWPSELTFNLFSNWFSYRFYSMLVELCDGPFIKQCETGLPE
jgi:hypothetical protein